MNGNGLDFTFDIGEVIAWLLEPFGPLFVAFLNIALGFLGIDLAGGES